MIMPKSTKEVIFYTIETNFCGKNENFETIEQIQGGVKLLLTHPLRRMKCYNAANIRIIYFTYIFIDNTIKGFITTPIQGGGYNLLIECSDIFCIKTQRKC